MKKEFLKRMVASLLAVLMIAGCAFFGTGCGNEPEPEEKPAVSETTAEPEPVEEEEFTYSEDVKELDASAEIGDHVLFGEYEQDNNASNGAERIEWRVLDIQDGKALLLSEKLLDCIKFNEIWITIPWSECTLRKWMNGDFLKNSFAADEQKKICQLTLENPDNPYYPLIEGENKPTKDRIFCLSYDEVEKYFSDNESRRAQLTPYAKEKDPEMDDENMGWWWLRTPGHDGAIATTVYISGEMVFGGSHLMSDEGCIRPAMWVKL